jgi:ribonuclease HI
MADLEKIIVYADGGSRGNPGPSAVGVVIKNSSNKTINEYGQKLEDELTNNEAEYEGVIFALKKLKALFGKKKTKQLEVEFRVDSELIASQLGGKFKVEQEHLQILYMKVHNQRFDFGKLKFKFIPREENQRADFLLNRALDEDKGKLF